jgi:hypothetical protein
VAACNSGTVSERFWTVLPAPAAAAAESLSHTKAGLGREVHTVEPCSNLKAPSNLSYELYGLVSEPVSEPFLRSSNFRGRVTAEVPFKFGPLSTLPPAPSLSVFLTSIMIGVHNYNSLFTQPPHEGQPSRSAHAASASAPPFQSGGGDWSRIYMGCREPRQGIVA